MRLVARLWRRRRRLASGNQLAPPQLVVIQPVTLQPIHHIGVGQRITHGIRRGAGQGIAAVQPLHTAQRGVGGAQPTSTQHGVRSPRRAALGCTACCRRLPGRPGGWGPASTTWRSPCSLQRWVCRPPRPAARGERHVAQHKLLRRMAALPGTGACSEHVMGHQPGARRRAWRSG